MKPTTIILETQDKLSVKSTGMTYRAALLRGVRCFNEEHNKKIELLENELKIERERRERIGAKLKEINEQRLNLIEQVKKQEGGTHGN